jgi:8-oxo-dGTP pyrophosphatase MutT (NUDIX family)
VLPGPEQLQALLLPPIPALPAAAELRRAAVLLLLCRQPQPLTCLTLRSMELPTHAGQISLPGGLVAATDSSMEATALREAREETALDPQCVQLLGRLPEVEVVSGVVITPVVGWTPEWPALKADPREVAELIPCPLQTVLDLSRYRRESLQRQGQRREFWVVDVGPHRVWGATAAILHALATRIADAG